jgi:uncharacterized protein YdeI (BOF family)
MKTLLILLGAILFSVSAMAQDTLGKSKPMQDQSTTMDKKDGYLMKHDKVMEIKDGKVSTLTADATLANGTVIMADGTVKNKDGSVVKLKNGEHIDLQGNITKNDKKEYEKP